MVGVCVCKRDMSGRRPLGYIGMLSVIPDYRGKGIGVCLHLEWFVAKGLAIRSINEMIQLKFSECFLETEIDNFAALNLYESLGFRRTEYLPRYYQNGNAAYRLMLQLENIYFPTVSSYWWSSIVCLFNILFVCGITDSCNWPKMNNYKKTLQSGSVDVSNLHYSGLRKDRQAGMSILKKYIF